jgi:hypothetical protein
MQHAKPAGMNSLKLSSRRKEVGSCPTQPWKGRARGSGPHLYPMSQGIENTDDDYLQVSSTPCHGSQPWLLLGLQVPVWGGAWEQWKEEQGVPLLFFYSLYCCNGWGYIVAFAQVLTMYQIYHI